MTTLAVDSIVIPDWIVALCANWYSGQDDMLYAVCSTGGLTIGTIRPSGCDCAEEWYLTIWREFSCDLGYAARTARKVRDVDADKLACAEKWVDKQVAALEACYGLADFEAC